MNTSSSFSPMGCLVSCCSSAPWCGAVPASCKPKGKKHSKRLWLNYSPDKTDYLVMQLNDLKSNA